MQSDGEVEEQKRQVQKTVDRWLAATVKEREKGGERKDDKRTVANGDRNTY